MSPVIEARGLHKHFGRTHALTGLDLTVETGEVHGFLGPNGAGKSTTIRLLLGLMRADGGSLRVFGLDPWRDAAAIHARLAYVPGDVSLWPNLTGGEAIDLITRLRGGALDGAFRRRRAELAEAFQFDPTKKARGYSKGNRQKVALIAALATPAELYVLDEPTSGLDPLMENVFTREIDALARRGATVLLSSHILSEVQALAQRVSIIRGGRTVETGTLAELRHLTRTEFSFTSDGVDPAAVAALPGARDVALDAGLVRFTADTDQVDEVLPALAALHVTGLSVAPPSLEDLFLRHYGAETAPGADSERAVSR